MRRADIGGLEPEDRVRSTDEASIPGAAAVGARLHVVVGELVVSTTGHEGPAEPATPGRRRGSGRRIGLGRRRRRRNHLDGGRRRRLGHRGRRGRLAGQERHRATIRGQLLANVLTATRRHDARGVDPLRDQIVLHGLSAVLAQNEVRLAVAGRVGVSVQMQRPRRVRLHPSRHAVERTDGVLIELVRARRKAHGDARVAAHRLLRRLIGGGAGAHLLAAGPLAPVPCPPRRADPATQPPNPLFSFSWFRSP